MIHPALDTALRDAGEALSSARQALTAAAAAARADDGPAAAQRAHTAALNAHTAALLATAAASGDGRRLETKVHPGIDLEAAAAAKLNRTTGAAGEPG